ncbi:MAG: hypothetical protein HY252_14920 [Sphingobacteriales bacterium]|nr:hypothetical protein [Sphingobacteriales bacterium]
MHKEDRIAAEKIKESLKEYYNHKDVTIYFISSSSRGDYYKLIFYNFNIDTYNEDQLRKKTKEIDSIVIKIEPQWRVFQYHEIEFTPDTIPDSKKGAVFEIEK